MSLFNMLYTRTDLDFYDASDSRPSWWKKSIFGQWKDTRTAGTAYNRILSFSNVSWGKIIHMRSAGIEYASAVGELSGGAVGTMSKHRVGKLDKVYLTELFPPVLRVMAGFKKKEDYNVMRATLDVPWSMEEICAFIFPKLHTWKLQWQSPNGDKSQAADNFLNKILPYLALVVVQDGIYYLRDFPEHELTKLILRVMPPNYEQWAKAARLEIESKTRIQAASQTESLNLATRSALQLVLSSMERGFQDQNNLIRALMKENRELKEQVQSALYKQYEEERQIVVREPEQVNEEDEEDESVLLLTQPEHNEDTVNTTPTTSPNRTEPRPRPKPPLRNLNEVLRNSEHIPVFPKRLPKTILEMKEQYYTCELQKWEGARMKYWELKISMSYERRKYLQHTMLARSRRFSAETEEQREEQAAISMDEERDNLGLTVYQYIKYLKARDPNIKRRKRNRSEMEEDDESSDNLD